MASPTHWFPECLYFPPILPSSPDPSKMGLHGGGQGGLSTGVLRLPSYPQHIPPPGLTPPSLAPASVGELSQHCLDGRATSPTKPLGAQGHPPLSAGLCPLHVDRGLQEVLSHTGGRVLQNPGCSRVGHSMKMCLLMSAILIKMQPPVQYSI